MQNYPGGGCKLIQDNDSKHRSKVCNNTYILHNIKWVFYLKKHFKKPNL